MKTSEEVLRLQRARDTLTDLTTILDEGNFNKHFDHRLFVVSGTRHSPNKMVKLTTPGRELARQKLAALAGESA